jgi:serine/threonine protein kinase
MESEASKSIPQTVGKYDLLEKIAEGGMGTVYRGRDRESGTIVAIKVVAPHMAENEVLLKRFEQEYTAARHLDHPNIVRALDFGNAGSSPYLVMEYVDGESLGQKLEREGPLPEKEAIRLIAQVAQGLYRAHKEKLIHRDVKPDNVMITADGQAKLTDLGLVKEVEADLNLTRTGRGLGTPHFMAPEQFKNAKNVDPRCDIYSLGATLYMLVTGEMPFKSSGPLDAYMKKIENKIVPPREIVPSLSERTDWAIRRALSADPDQRPSTCREFVEDLTGRSTRKLAPAAQSTAVQDVWYLVYKDEEGDSHTVKGSTQGIRRSLKDSLLGDASNIRASRSKDGAFESLRSFPEFRDLIVVPASSGPGSGVKALSASERSKSKSKFPPPAPDDKTAMAGHSAVTSKTPVPRIDLEPRKKKKKPLPWLQWIFLLLVVILSALAGWYFLPH